jgi:hypothetical protein
VLVSCGVENWFGILEWIHSNGWDRDGGFRGMSTSMLRGLKVERRSESGGAARKVEGRVVSRWYKDMLVDPSIWWHEGIRFPFAQRAPRCVLAWMSTQLLRPAKFPNTICCSRAIRRRYQSEDRGRQIVSSRTHHKITEPIHSVGQFTSTTCLILHHLNTTTK